MQYFSVLKMEEICRIRKFICIKYKEETDNGDAENDESGKAKDVLIDDVYSNVPRSGPFILKCAAEGKYYMSQLTDEDFESAVNLRGIGVTTIENLRRIYLEFVNSSSDCLRNTKNREYKYSLDLIVFAISKCQ